MIEFVIIVIVSIIALYLGVPLSVIVGSVLGMVCGAYIMYRKFVRVLEIPAIHNRLNDEVSEKEQEELQRDISNAFRGF